MIQYLHRNYLRTHPFNPNQPETCFLRLPHWFIFTLVLSGNFLAAVSFHSQAPFLLLSTPTHHCLASTHPSLCREWQWHSVGNTQEIQSQRRPFGTTCEEGQITGKSQETPTCFSRTSVILWFTCYSPLYMENATGKATQISSVSTQTLEWSIFFFLCSSQRDKVVFWAEALLIGAVQLLVFFWS